MTVQHGAWVCPETMRLIATGGPGAALRQWQETGQVQLSALCACDTIIPLTTTYTVLIPQLSILFHIRVCVNLLLSYATVGARRTLALPKN